MKYFGHTDVIGETLTIENFSGGKHGFVVTAVLKNLPNNSVSRPTSGIGNGIIALMLYAGLTLY